MQRRIAVIGASGYTGVELTRLLAAHPHTELAVASSDRWVGDTIEARVGAPTALRYIGLESAIEQATSCDVVMLATPAEASHELVPKLLGRGPRVIDLSGAYRLTDAAQYPKHYGFTHAHPDLLAEAIYGLPELFRDRIAGARLIANPGCYATAIQLALAPLVQSATGRIIVDAMSGVSGAGRKAAEEYSFVEVANDLRAYRVLRHQHRPEIEQGLALANYGRHIDVTFVPHLLPIPRGILATCHVTTHPDVKAAFESRYASEPFVVLAPSAEAVTLHDVVGTNKCRIGVTVSERGEVVVVAAIDNLVKGAAGQAIQNMNLMLGLPETTGLATLRSFHP